MAKRPDVPLNSVWIWTGSTLLSFDGQNLVINRVAGANKGTFSYPVDQISGLQVTQPRLFQLGVFRVLVAGEVGPRRTGRGGMVEATRDPFAVQFPKSGLPKVEAISAAVREAQAALRQTRPVSSATAVAPTGSQLGDQLAQLGQLHGAGVLSDAEFATAKARLLGPPQDAPPNPTQ